MIENLELNKEFWDSFKQLESIGAYNDSKECYDTERIKGMTFKKPLFALQSTLGDKIIKVDLSKYDLILCKKIAALICTLIASPIFPINHTKRFWYRLKVKPLVNPMRTHGVGTNPFHIDYLTRQNPPDLIAFLCINPDPFGGGQTALSNIKEAVKQLSNQKCDILQQTFFSYFRDKNVNSLGKYLNQFAIIPDSNKKHIRFTAKMKNVLETNPEKILNNDGLKSLPEIIIALSELEEILIENELKFLLGSKELLIFEQMSYVHSRHKLLGEQMEIIPSKRRLILQGYLSYGKLEKNIDHQ